MRAFDAALNTPWAIRPEALAVLLDMARRAHEPDIAAALARQEERQREINAMSAAPGTMLEGTRSVTMRGSVAVVALEGPIFRYANLFTSLSGATSLQMIAHDFHTALNNPNVESILFHVDSPGGQANGVGEFADMVYESRGKKPILAYVSHEGASAAYWIASACDEIIASPMSVLGSIGVVAGVPNPNGHEQHSIEFVSSQSPRKRVDPTSDGGRAQIQALVDDWAEVFVTSVARNRNVSVEKVLSDFGRGDVLIGRKSVEAGLADREGSFESVVKRLQTKSQPLSLAAAATNTVRTTGSAMNIQLSTPQEAKRKMSFRERLMSFISSTPDDELEPETSAVAASEPAPPPGETTPAPAAETLTVPTPEGGTDPMSDQIAATAGTAATLDNAELRALREQLAASEAARRRMQAERIHEQAAEWADRVITLEHHAAPVEADHLIGLYVRMATDDLLLPLEAEGGMPATSRVHMLKAAYSARPENLLDRETLITGLRDVQVVANTIRSVTPANTGPDGKMTAERRKQLLGYTALGKDIERTETNGAAR